MSLKIEVNNSATAYHVVTGPQLFPYAVDARNAISLHPLEWKATPWSAEETAEGRRFIKERHARETADAEARKRAEAEGLPAPLPLDEEVELSPEDEAALEQHMQAVAEANERLAKFRAEQEEKRKIAEQVAADEAIVNSAPPVPAPKRPFGRKGEPTQAELEQIKKRDAKKADDERIAREKAELDRQSNSNAKITT